MLTKDGIMLNMLENAKFSQPWSVDNVETTPNLHRYIGSGSGGYADNIFLFASKELFDEGVTNVTYKPLRYN